MPVRTRSRSRSVVRRVRRRTGGRLARIRSARKRINRSRVTGRNVHTFCRWGTPSAYSAITAQGSLRVDSNLLYSGGVVTTNASTSSVNWCAMSTQFTWSDVANSAELAALYDQYKINGILVTIKMISNPDASYVSGGTTVNQYINYFPTLWYVRDNDDVALQTLDNIREYKNVRKVVMKPQREVKIFIKPRMLRQIFNSNTEAAYEVAAPRFIDLANSATPHYGLKFIFDFDGLSLAPIAGAPNNQWRFRVNYKYYFSMKDVR